MELQAYGKNILIETEPTEEATASGIIVAKETQDLPTKGTLVSIGDLVGDKLKLGQKVVFRKYAGGKGCKAGGKNYAIVHEDDILLYGQV